MGINFEYINKSTIIDFLLPVQWHILYEIVNIIIFRSKKLYLLI